MKLLLTGATGFVGRNFLLRAIKEDRYDKIYVPVRSRAKLETQLSQEGFPSIPSQIEIVDAQAPAWDLADLPAVDHVVHSAGLISGRTRDDYFKTNTEGTRTLLKQLREGSRIVILSSMAAAGPCAEGEHVKDESAVMSPVTWYGQSKLAMEELIQREFSHLGCVCLRPPMVLGPRDQASLPLFKMVRNYLRFKPGFRVKHYSFIAVADLVSAIFATADSRVWHPGTYFVAADEPVTDRELIDCAGRALSRKGLVLPLPQSFLRGVSRVVEAVPAWRQRVPNLGADRSNEIWPDRWVVSPKAFQSRYAWRAEQGIQDTLFETAAWYQRTDQL